MPGLVARVKKHLKNLAKMIVGSEDGEETPAQNSPPAKKPATNRLRQFLKEQQREGRLLFQQRKKAMDSYVEEDKSKIMCSICLDPLVQSVTTFCSHSFCRLCFEELTIRKELCPICRVSIRKSEPTRSKSLDWYVSLGQQYSSDILKKRKEVQQFYQEKRVSEFEEDMLLDVRDQEYVWCKALVKKVFMDGERQMLHVHYLGWSEYYDEVLEAQSSRIAKLGTFTSREDVPKYRLNERIIAEINISLASFERY